MMQNDILREQQRDAIALLMVKVQFRYTNLTKRMLKFIRTTHMHQKFYHRALHIILQMEMKWRMEAFYRILKLVRYAPEEYWEWQGKNGFFRKIKRALGGK